jgi:serine protease Do
MNGHGSRMGWALVALLLAPALARAQARTTGAAAVAPPDLAAFKRGLQVLVERVSPAVVNVIATGYTAAAGPSAGGLLSAARGNGSGVILDPTGYIVTNAHVVEGARRVQVALATPQSGDAAGRSILKVPGRVFGARVIGMDRETDLAVLKVEQDGLPTLPLGDSEALRQGELVMAFGSPLGLEGSVSLGVVSAVARQLRPDDPMIYVQTDAAVNPGNSGGPLVDAEGRVVGINTLIMSQSGGNEGVGFAAPSNIVRTVYEQIRATGRMRRGEIGVSAQTLTPVLAAGLGIKRDRGVILADVRPNGPAAAAGLRPGDVVLAVNDKPMENARQFEVNVYQRRVGDTIAIDYLRGSEAKRTTAAVTERQNDPERFADLVDPDENLIPRLGILGIEVDKRLAAMIGNELRWPGGVLVAARAATAPPGASALERGDVIIAVNGTNVAGLSDFRAAVGKLPPRAACVLHIQRGTRLLYVGIELE